MPDGKNGTVRINIYVHDPEIRKRVKEAAARAGQSMSEYCLDAILTKISGCAPREKVRNNPAERARRFRERVFGGELASITAADLVRESREQH